MAERERERRVTRGMPNNIDAEASVLGSILIDNKAADNVIPMLRAEDFYLSQNRIIFAVMKELQETNKPIDTVSVSDMLEQRGQLDEVGSIGYLSELAEGVPSAANSEYYSRIVKRDSLTRRVIEAGNGIAKFGYECAEGSEALNNAEKLVYQIAEESSEKALVKADDALATAIKNIQDDQTGNVPKNLIMTDFPSFDYKTKGLKPGELVLLAARPSVGKTAFALNIAANACLNHGKNVAIFSLEMPDYLLIKRMLAYVSKVSLSKMSTQGGLSASDNGKLFKAYNALLSAQLYIDDYSMNGPSDVLSKCRRLKRESGLDLIIIDYLQLMTSGGRGKAPESRQVEVSDMSRKMKIYAKELGVPIILLSQMSRSVEQRDGHSPMLSDLRESGSIEQDADIVAFLHNPSKFNAALPENQVILDIKKNRNGPIGEVKLEWDGETTSFCEVYDAEYSDNQPKKSVIMSASPVDMTLKEVSTSVLPFDEVASDINSTSDSLSDLHAIASASMSNLPFSVGSANKLKKNAKQNKSNANQEKYSAKPNEIDNGDLPFDRDRTEVFSPSSDEFAPPPSDDDAPFDTDDEYIDE